MNFESMLEALETGRARAAEPGENGAWKVNSEVKQAILSAFRAGEVVAHGEFLDKHTLLPRRFSVEQKVRLVPGGTSVRRGAYLAPGVIVMPPSYVNVGAYVGEGTMVDSHVLVGSCAQIGARVHLSAGVQVGGVLEPVGACPVVVEDEAFIGAGCLLVEGVRISRRAVLAPGVVLSRSTRVIDLVHERELAAGEPIPEGAVVIPGSRPVSSTWGRERGLTLQTPLIVKYRDLRTDAGVALEEALR